MNSSNPKVSVVLPTYQRAQCLQSAISDLLAQSLTDFELWVMDDGSTDRTSEVVQGIADPRIHYQRKEHLGMPAIVNAGMTLCRGEYIMICHDHDGYQPDLLQSLSDALDQHRSAAFAHSGVVTVDPSGARQTARYVADFPELSEGKRFLVEHLLPKIASPVTALSMIRKSVLKGEFLDPTYGGAADVELWMRLSTRGDIAYINRPLIRVRERAADSVYFLTAYMLSESAIRAKRSYLHYAPAAQRGAIAATWRKGADVEGLWTLRRLLEHHQLDRVAEIQGFVSREGSLTGVLAVRVIAALPPPASRWALEQLRGIRRNIRKLRSPAGLRN